MEDKKVRFIAIRNEALLNSELKPFDKYLLMVLEDRKLFKTENDGWYNIEIRGKKLRKLTFTSDNRTILRSLNRLKNKGLVDYDFDKFHSVNKTLIKINCKPPFVLVDREMFYKINELDIKEKPYNILVLYYILEHYHNPNYGNGENGIACPSRRMINDSLKMNSKKMSEYIILMHDNYICEFCQGRFYDKNQRSRNRYLPNTIQHKNGEPNIGNRRYKTHKRESYFGLPMDDY